MKTIETPAGKPRLWFERLTKFEWQPKPIEPPVIDPEVEHLNGLQRAAEAFRFTILRAEYWLSPRGTLREWCRFNLTAGTVLAMPAMLVVPVITFLLSQFSTWTGLLVTIATNLVVFPFVGLAAFALLSGVVVGVRVLIGR